MGRIIITMPSVQPHTSERFSTAEGNDEGSGHKGKRKAPGVAVLPAVIECNRQHFGIREPLDVFG